MLVRRRRHLRAWAAVLIVFAAAAALGAILAVRANRHDRRARPAPARTVVAAPTEARAAPRTTAPAVSFSAAVTVPRVIGEKVSEARKAIRDAGLIGDERRVPSELRKQTVVAQAPGPGTTAERGDRVVLAVSI